MAILAIIDLRHQGRLWPAVELGHARVASVAIALTALAAIGIHTPQGFRIGWIGVTPILIFALYIAAIAWFRRAPSLSRTNVAQPGLRLQEPIGWSTEEGAVSLRRVAARFVAASLVILASAPIMTVNVERIAEISGITQTFIGVSLLAITTSIPELVASLAAIGIGAYDLAVGNLFGTANMSVLLFADVVYTNGPILSAAAPTQIVAAVGAILLMAPRGRRHRRWNRNTCPPPRARRRRPPHGIHRHRRRDGRRNMEQP